MIRPLRVLLAASVCALLLPGVAAARTSAKAPSTLVATAAVPGQAAPARASYDLTDDLAAADLRFERRTAADTLVATGPVRVQNRRGAWVTPPRPCVRVTVRVALHPGAVDGFALTEAAVPVADANVFQTFTRSPEALGASATPPVLWIDRRRDNPRWKAGERAAEIVLVDWAGHGTHGFESVTARGEILRVGRDVCRARTFEAVPTALLDMVLPGS